MHFYFKSFGIFAKFAVFNCKIMIQELKIKNFKSFRDEAELSFEPSGEDRYNSIVTMPDGVQLIRFAVVLGANASGKSNLLEAVEFYACSGTTFRQQTMTEQMYSLF